jgi:TM2 domain-containing membrane protein YozV
VIHNVINNQTGQQVVLAPIKSVGAAYGLWALGLIGLAGFHRFYLGKSGTGILWLLTVGLFFIGTLVDLFTIPSQVKAVNAANGHGYISG